MVVLLVFFEVTFHEYGTPLSSVAVVLVEVTPFLFVAVLVLRLIILTSYFKKNYKFLFLKDLKVLFKNI